MKEIRIATNTKTGRKHMVNRLDFDRNLVFVFGPVVGCKSNGSTEHLPGGSFPINESEIVKVKVDGKLANELFLQTVKFMEEGGFVKTGKAFDGSTVVTPLKPFVNVGI